MLADVLQGFIETGLVDIEQCDFASFACKYLCSAPADAGRGASDNRDLVFESHSLPPPGLRLTTGRFRTKCGITCLPNSSIDLITFSWGIDQNCCMPIRWSSPVTFWMCSSCLIQVSGLPQITVQFLSR